MTKEEAAEEILQGRAWKTCPAPGCKEGLTYAEDHRGISTTCFNCDGYGTVLRQRYAKACRMLRRPQPERTHMLAFATPIMKIIEENSMKDLSALIDEEFIIKYEVGDE